MLSLVGGSINCQDIPQLFAWSIIIF